MKVAFAMLLLWLLTAAIVAPLVYAAWNLALAPWLGWREMPVSVALLAGFAVALLTVRVRQA